MRMILIGLSVALLSAPAQADVKAGVDAYERGEYAAAITIWRPLAIAGDADAQFNLAQAYRLGRGTPADPKLAEIWFEKAANQGHLKARDAYGLQLFQNGNQTASMPYVEESAGRGDPRAQYVFATALFNGDYVKKDWVRAYALMTRASSAGISAASTSLAQMDRFIPLDQRQRGLALAGAFEAASQRPTGPATPASPTLVASEPVPAPVSTPVSTPISTPPAQIAIATPSPRPVALPSAPTIREPTPARVVAAPAAPKPVAVAKPAPVLAASVPGGAWRVQLGAFSNAAGANTLWSSLSSRVSALAPYRSFIVPAGSITRLQAGPLRDRAAAEKLCSAIKASGNPCLSVAP
jgi:uncharacterized protein